MAAIRIPTAKNNPTIEHIAVTCVRILIGIILLTAGLAKVADFSTFVTQVALYDVVPTPAIQFMSACLLSAEIALGLALTLGYFSRVASILAAGLFGIFIVVLAQALWRDMSLDDCACRNILFGLFHWEVGLSWKMVFVDAILLVGCLFVAIANSTGYRMDFFRREEKAQNGSGL